MSASRDRKGDEGTLSSKKAPELDRIEGSPEAGEPDDPIEEYADRQADQELICELYSKLNSKQKEILSDRFNEELSYERISEKRGIPIGTAKSIISRIVLVCPQSLYHPVS